MGDAGSDQTVSAADPGLAKDINPKPDHGEQSYHGFGRLASHRAVITGANSGIGRAVAIAFAREGADVVLNYLPSEEAAITAYTHALAKQVASKGIRVNGVAPGPIWPPLQPSGGQPGEKLLDFGSEVPMGRPGQPAELAPVYVLLASQESSFVTGEICGVTGGNHLP